jgi:hypothetical protein
MANNRFNKQATPKGYKAGGRIKKMGGGMMMQRPMYDKGGVATEAKKKQFKANQAGQKTTNKKAMEVAKKFIPDPIGVGVKLAKRLGKKMGGSLKAVPADNKGLKKLPTEVRNKMGFMKDGGTVSMTSSQKQKAMETLKKYKGKTPNPVQKPNMGLTKGNPMKRTQKAFGGIAVKLGKEGLKYLKNNPDKVKKIMNSPLSKKTKDLLSKMKKILEEKNNETSR